MGVAHSTFAATSNILTCIVQDEFSKRDRCRRFSQFFKSAVPFEIFILLSAEPLQICVPEPKRNPSAAIQLPSQCEAQFLPSPPPSGESH